MATMVGAHLPAPASGYRWSSCLTSTSRRTVAFDRRRGIKRGANSRQRESSDEPEFLRTQTSDA
jgi:hypothetical protein